MEPLTGEYSPEDIPGRKKSKLKILKSRLFKKSKKEDEGQAKLSQSTSDITAGKGLDSEEDLTCSEVMLGSRALSHESIFVADEVLADPEPSRVLSHENVHTKIKALQEKLQQQNLHLGPPSMSLSLKRPGHLARASASQEALNKEILQPSAKPVSPAYNKSPTRFMAPMPSPSATPAALLTSPTTAAGLASDFSSPAKVASCLDTSAARHRMSIKPRNQRASTKRQKTHASPLANLPNDMNHPAFEEETSCPAEEESSMSSHSIQIPQSEPEGVNLSLTPQGLRLKSPEAEAITQEAQAASQPEGHTTHQLLGAKSLKPIDQKYWQQPASSCVTTEGSEIDHLADLGIQAVFHAISNDFNSTGLKGKNLESEHSSQEVSTTSLLPSFGSVGSFRSSSLNQHGTTQPMAEVTQRQGQGSGPFNLSSVKGQVGERPRSSSFVVQGATRFKGRTGTMVKSFTSNVDQSQGHGFQKKRKEEEHLGDLQQQRGAGIAKDGEVKDKGELNPLERRVTFKKGKSVQLPKQAAIMTGALAAVEGSQEGVEESVDAEEVLEDQGTTAFGVKLRSTSLSLRYRTEGSASSVQPNSTEMAKSALVPITGHPTSASLCSGGKGDKRNIGDTETDLSSVHRRGTRPWSLLHAGGAAAQPSFSSLPDKANHTEQAEVSVPTPETLDISLNTKDIETTEDTQRWQGQATSQSAPQSVPADVSWMSMAMEKTRSLFSSMPRDFTGMQSNSRQPTPAQLANQGKNSLQFQANKDIQSQAQLASQTQGVAQQHDMPQTQATSQPLTEAIKPPVIKAVTSAQTAQHSQVSPTAEQNIPLNASKTTHMQNTSQISKQAHNMPFQHTIAQQIIPSSTNAAAPSLAAPSLRPSTQTESRPQSAPGSNPYSFAQANVSYGQQPTAQQPSRGGSLQYSNQFKPMTGSAPTSSNNAPSPAQAPALAAQGGAAEDGAAPSGRRTAWQSSVGERAAFPEFRTEGGTTRGFKVDQTKTQTNTESSVDDNTLMNKDATSERRPGGQLAESSPSKILDRLADNEEKKAGHRMQTSSTPSSSATPSSPLQSASVRSQPSWMELAKRKSMAWSDKTMD